MAILILTYAAAYLLTGVLVAAFAQWLQSTHGDKPLDDVGVVTVLLLWPIYTIIAIGAAIYFYTLAGLNWLVDVATRYR